MVKEKRGRIITPYQRKRKKGIPILMFQFKANSSVRLCIKLIHIQNGRYETIRMPVPHGVPANGSNRFQIVQSKKKLQRIYTEIAANDVQISKLQLNGK